MKPPPRRRGGDKKEELMKMLFWNIREVGVLEEESN